MGGYRVRSKLNKYGAYKLHSKQNQCSEHISMVCSLIYLVYFFHIHVSYICKIYSETSKTTYPKYKIFQKIGYIMNTWKTMVLH